MHHDESSLRTLKREALENGKLLEVVVGSAPGWADPWSRGVVAQVIEGSSEWDLWLYDGDGFAIHDEDVQIARRIEDVDDVEDVEDNVVFLH